MPLFPSTSNWLVFFPIAVAIVVAMQLSAAMRGVPRDALVSRIMNQLVVTMFGLALCGLAIRVSIVGGIWMVVLALLVLVIWWKHRTLERSQALLVIQAAETERQRELIVGELLRCNGGLIRSKAYRILSQLRQGVPWGQAVEKSGLTATVQERIDVRLQARYGFSSLRNDENGTSLQTVNTNQDVQQLLGRLMIVSWAVALGPALYFYFYYFLPTLLEILAEFEMKPTPLMQFFSDFNDLLWSNRIGQVVLFCASFIYLLVIAPVILWLFPQLASLPLIRRLFSNYHKAIGLQALARISTREPDLQTACAATAEVMPLPFVAGRYRQAAKSLMAGQAPEQALASAGVSTSREAHAMAHGLRSAHPAWSLQQLATWKIERLLGRYQVLVQYFVVAMTMFLAIIVGVLAFFTFELLSAMILEVSTWQ